MGLNKLVEFCETNTLEYKLNEPMCRHTSFKIGGGADIFINIRSAVQLSELVKKANELNIPYFILGKGSNLLVSDNGIEGAVISLSALNEIDVQNKTIICGAGATLSEVCRVALDNSLSGLEFAYGIPGSIGGAVYMNAGAYGGEMASVVLSAECLDKNGEIITVKAKDMDFGYRKSIFKSSGLIVLSVKLGLETAEKQEIDAKMQDLISRRCEKQPLEYPSAGSFFKRPEGNFAGALIEKNGLKGFSVGDAEISKKHAGFVINKGNAACKDVLELKCRVADIVLKNDGVSLEPEVIFIGRK